MKKGKCMNQIMVVGNRKKAIIGSVFPFSLDMNFKNKH